MPSILSLFLSFLYFISSSSSFPTTNPSSHSSLQFSSTLRKTGHQLIKDLNLHPNLEVNIFKPSANSSNDEFKVFESGIVEKRLSFQVLGESGATVQDLAQRAGYFHLQHTIDARMFYFFFESRKAKADPVVIWLTGGPGCSSELALFYENGPFKITNNLSLVWNDYGWDKVSNIIFVDQPTGTGFSYSSSEEDIRIDETGVSNDLYNFLQAFFKAHPDYVNNDFYITGESYAGHYIPAFAARVNQGNKNKEGIPINLKGFGIGNGLTNPGIQYQAYTDYALANNMISKSEYNQINEKIPACEQAIKQCGTTGTFTCQLALNSCQQIFEDILSITDNINYYDIRKKCEGTLCYDFSNLEKFLVQSSVKTALGVPSNIEFVSCSDRVYQAMIDDWMRNLEVGIPALLEQNIKLLVYAGEYDLICNWLGKSSSSNLFLLVLISQRPVSSARSQLHDPFSTSLHSITGNELITQLNLHPKLDVNIFKANISDSVSTAASRIVEKQLRLPILGHSGASIQDLSHLAGYVRIKHTGKEGSNAPIGLINIQKRPSNCTPN